LKVLIGNDNTSDKTEPSDYILISGWIYAYKVSIL
jgi:hypothetical protein